MPAPPSDDFNMTAPDGVNGREPTSLTYGRGPDPADWSLGAKAAPLVAQSPAGHTFDGDSRGCRAKPRILYTRPSITSREVSYATDAAANGWGARCYDYLDRFEAAFSEHIHVPYAIATSSCTGALHMGLSALGVGPGDEVIIAESNWVASVAPVVYLGATPVFVDIRPDTWCIDPDRVEAALTPRTRAIIAVHLYGNMCDMSALQAIGERHNIVIVEDAAEALGSAWQDRKAGAIGTFGVFSFHGSKTLTTGEGGAFVTSDSALYEKVLSLSFHGRARGQTRQFWPDTIGFKYKMSNMQAAIGVAQMERVDELLGRKREIFERYSERLSGYNSISLNPEPAGTRNGYWMPTAVFTKQSRVTREILLAAFAAENIDARVFFWPLSALPCFPSAMHNIHAYDLPGRAINLPSYHDMTDDDIDRVVNVLTGTLGNSDG